MPTSKKSPSALSLLLDSIRQLAQNQTDKGKAFEELCIRYLKNEPLYQNLYKNVQFYQEWAKEYGQNWGLSPNDTGIDLVATTEDDEFHAFQCKCYAANHSIKKSDIDSFLAASDNRAFSLRYVIDTTTRPWGKNAEETLPNKAIPVQRIQLRDLENSQIDWSSYNIGQAQTLIKSKNQPYLHQQAAIDDVLAGLQKADRGKLIMACGTGKTFTSLKIAEQQAGIGKMVLFLVPSLALAGQTLRAWSGQSNLPLRCFVVCSDTSIGKNKNADDDIISMALHDLSFPATTDSERLARQVQSTQNDTCMRVVFSTYQSIDVIHLAQNPEKKPAGADLFDQYQPLPEFDLVICDEAHRTTGQTFAEDKRNEKESDFVRIHNNDFIRAKKRLYMTATPRIYDEAAKTKAAQKNFSGDNSITLYSMDDENHYGQVLHTLNFQTAVQQKLLVPYKVIVLTIEENEINERVKKELEKELAGDKKPGDALLLNDAAKIIGCFKALIKEGVTDDLADDFTPMRRALAFCQVVDRSQVTNKNVQTAAVQIANHFESVIAAYQESGEQEEQEHYKSLNWRCAAQHVSGSMHEKERDAAIDWLKQETDNECRVLTNVRCLSEGVDVPALDAVLFLTPRNSQVDVVQSIGRVMRTSPGKKRGYIILPVVIPFGKEPHQALNDNKTYQVVWRTLQALRAHDETLEHVLGRWEYLEPDNKLIEVIPATGLAAQRKSRTAAEQHQRRALGLVRSGSSIGEDTTGALLETPPRPFEIERAILAKIVKKVGNRQHWEQWAGDIARLARLQIERIERILQDSTQQAAQNAFAQFKKQLHQQINARISQAEIIEMLAQHLITKPVFDALLGGSAFSQNNPISAALGQITEVLLADTQMEKERAHLEGFYDGIRRRAEGIEHNPQARQKLIIRLYDEFFSQAFPRVVQKHGIVYTPIEVVDFILHSVAHILESQFNKSLADPEVSILDPFTGTGTFIARLLASGLISREQLPALYQNSLHANEILLLPYYIAAVNIESTYQQCCPEQPYTPFPGILLADTFNIPTEKPRDMVEQLEQNALAANSERRRKQMESKITVIVGNPPYSVGQDSANDNNQNVAYPELDARIETTYAAKSSANLKKGLYDSYIRAIRWASNRIDPETGGILGFVTNAGWLDSAATDGMRKCLIEEFSCLYIFHLRGNQRTHGEQSRKEGGKIFGSGSRAPIAISLLVKMAHSTAQHSTAQHSTAQHNCTRQPIGKIYFYDIGDYLSREQKLEKISTLQSIAGIGEQNLWQTLSPDENGDWLNQRRSGFNDLLPMGDAKNKNKPGNTGMFENFSLGVVTNRDPWCNNFSREALLKNVKRMIDFYENQRFTFNKYHAVLDSKGRTAVLDKYIDTDPTKISWTRALKNDLARDKALAFHPQAAVPTLYRPFTKGWLYYDRRLNEMVCQMPQLFPLPVADAEKDEAAQGSLLAAAQPATPAQTAVENRLICVSGVGSRGFSVLMTNQIPSLDCIEKGQCFPEYLYDQDGQRKEAITDTALKTFQDHYEQDGQSISKPQLFEYIYAVLHSPDYRKTFANNLIKELPRLPFAANFEDFCLFAEAGKQLADLHIGYETEQEYEGVEIRIHKNGCHTLDDLTESDFYVEKLKYGKIDKTPENKTGKNLTVIHYNPHISIHNIPLAAYDYVVNGRPALDWLIDRQGIRTDKASQIVSDANRYAIETVGNPRYPLELILRVISVSLKTQAIIKSLSKARLAL